MTAVSVIFRKSQAMSQSRSYSRYTTEAITLLGKLIKLGRKKRKWSEFDLAERAGISRDTIQRIEKGDPTCSLGLVFEAASLVGIPLFDPGKTSLASHLKRTDDLLTLMPKSVRKSNKAVDDDF